MTKPVHLLVDGDIVAYRASCSKGPDGNPPTMDYATQRLEDHLQYLKDNLQADRISVILSDKANFRRALYEPYKANRDGTERPTLLEDLKQYLRDKHGAFALEWLEADDTMGILATEPCDELRVMVSIDKDMKQIPGYLLNPGKWAEGVQTITPELADAWFYRQLLTGDSTDNIPGCPTIGEKRAAKLLDGSSPDEWWAICKATFEKHHLDENYAVLQARLVRLLRYEDYDMATGEISLWLPDGKRELRKFS